MCDALHRRRRRFELAHRQAARTVIDTSGRVHGTERLSVVDASIVPNGQSAFRHIPTTRIPERLSQQVTAAVLLVAPGHCDLQGGTSRPTETRGARRSRTGGLRARHARRDVVVEREDVFRVHPDRSAMPRLLLRRARGHPLPRRAGRATFAGRVQRRLAARHLRDGRRALVQGERSRSRRLLARVGGAAVGSGSRRHLSAARRPGLHDRHRARGASTLVASAPRSTRRSRRGPGRAA